MGLSVQVLTNDSIHGLPPTQLPVFNDQHILARKNEPVHKEGRVAIVVVL